MNNYCKQGNCECKFMEDTRRYAIDVPELYKRIDTATDQYNAVVAQNKSLQGELRLANRIIDSMAETLAVDDDCNNWNEVITCQSETIPCEECIKKYYEQQALQQLEAENDSN